MSDATPPFAFSQFVPGFDFLKNLAGGANPGGGAVPGLPSLSNWVAPTLSVEEVDKRIQELKTVQYWLEQNGHALKATIQALEVQKMTLSTLRGMNVQMEDLAKAFTRTAATAAEPMEPPAHSAPAEAAAPEAVETETSPSEPPQTPEKGAAAGVVDPLQWWNALTQQFQQIAQTAVEDAGQLKMPGAVVAPAARPAAAKRTTPKKAAATKTSTSTKTAKTTARKTMAASRPRSR